MTKTKEELILATLEELVVLGGGQDAPAEDIQTVERFVQPLVDDLAARNVIYIADIDAIEEGHFLHLAVLLAYACAHKFEKQRDRTAKAEAEAALRTISRIGRGTGGKLKVDCALRPRGRA